MALPVPPRLPLSRTKARNCAFLNQLGTPGLGSLLAGRFVSGALQLALAVGGFGLIVTWFAITLTRFYRLMNENAEITPSTPGWLGILGASLFALAWFWSLATSISMVRHSSDPNDLASPEN